MARKKSFIGTLLKLGTLAAATAVIYKKREEIRDLLTDVAERLFPEDAEAESTPDFVVEEHDIVIDATENSEKEDHAEEGAAEEA